MKFSWDRIKHGNPGNSLKDNAFFFFFFFCFFFLIVGGGGRAGANCPETGLKARNGVPENPS